MYLPEHDEHRLTDEMERRLMMEAIEEQMQPHPVRALKAVLRKLMARIKTT